MPYDPSLTVRPYTGRGGARGVTLGVNPTVGSGTVGVVVAGATRATWAEDLARRGYAVAVPELGWRGAAPADHEGLADLGAARTALGVARVAFVGFGEGGLLCRLAACSFPRTVAAVDFAGVLVHARISPVHPAQPLDLLPGLRCGLQYHVGAEDPDVDPMHIGDLEKRLMSVNQPSQVFVYPGVAGRFWENPRVMAVAWARACAFLGHGAAGEI